MFEIRTTISFYFVTGLYNEKFVFERLFVYTRPNKICILLVEMKIS
jgi:hypothetical protein